MSLYHIRYYNSSPNQSDNYNLVNFFPLCIIIIHSVKGDYEFGNYIRSTRTGYTWIGVTNISSTAGSNRRCPCPKAPPAITGDNVYVAWWTKTGNDEVLFRASTDAGKTFGDKINLSNTTEADSRDVER